jgi:osmotically-inducible protein OsmY
MNPEIVERLRRIIEDEPRIVAVGAPIAVDLDADGGVTLDGEVATVASKRLTLDLATALVQADSVTDRLRVAPERRLADEQVRRRLFELLADDPLFASCEVRRRGAMARAVRGGAKPFVEVGVDDGVVTLRGRLETWTQKCLAGVYAWWAPGSRDVVNLLSVERESGDGDAEIVSALRLVLEKDPLIASVPEVSVRDGVVTLTGTVGDGDESDAAEADAWYVLGVHEVANVLKQRH